MSQELSRGLATLVAGAPFINIVVVLTEVAKTVAQSPGDFRELRVKLCAFVYRKKYILGAA